MCTTSSVQEASCIVPVKFFSFPAQATPQGAGSALPRRVEEFREINPHSQDELLAPRILDFVDHHDLAPAVDDVDHLHRILPGPPAGVDRQDGESF